MIRTAINNAIQHQGISKYQVAQDLELNYQNFLRFLGGHRTMPLKDLERVLQYLHISLVEN